MVFNYRHTWNTIDFLFKLNVLATRFPLIKKKRVCPGEVEVWGTNEGVDRGETVVRIYILRGESILK